jgi:hypothetical protein
MRSLLCSLALLLFISCNNNKETGKKEVSEDTVISKKDEPNIRDGVVTGVWRPVEIGMPMSPEKKKEILDSATIEFTDNGTYISNFGDKKETGTYTYDQEGRTLVTISSDKREDRFAVAWNSGLLMLSTRQDGTMVLQRK